LIRMPTLKVRDADCALAAEPEKDTPDTEMRNLRRFIGQIIGLPRVSNFTAKSLFLTTTNQSW
jgi:hypothetical protein